MTDEYRIRELHAEDLDALTQTLTLHNSTYDDVRWLDQWQWEYVSAYPDLYVFTVTTDGNKVIGSQGMIPIHLNIGGKRTLTGKSENSLLDPTYRGGSTFVDLYEHAVDLCRTRGMTCIWGFTPAVRVWRKKLGFQAIEGVMQEAKLVIGLWQTVKSTLRSKRSPLKKCSVSLAAIALWGYSRIRQLIMATGGVRDVDYSVESTLRDDSDLRELYRRIRVAYPTLVHIDQDTHYLNWRLYQNPNIEYGTRFVYQGDALRGYCYAGRLGNGVATLTDILFENSDVARLLLKHQLADWRRDRARTVTFFGNNSNALMQTVFNLLRRFGFAVRKSEQAIVIRNLSVTDEKSLYDVSNWFASGFWTEGYSL